VALRADELDRGAVDLDRDRRLVLRYQQGDESAFEELYRRYYPRLHLYCQRRVGDVHASEELAQEAFIRAMRAMPRFAGERRFYPWMTVIAQRLCIDHHRRTSRVEPTAEVDLGVIEEEHEELFGSVDRDHLASAMCRLAPRHRDVLGLREEQGWTYQQIADHLEVPVTTVEALLHRARKALKREFLAVSSGTRLASFPIVGWVLVRMARIRARMTGHTAGELAPIAGSAVAGIAAVTLVLAPFVAPSSSGDRSNLSVSAPHVAVTSTAATAAPLVTSASAPVTTTTTTAATAHHSSTAAPSDSRRVAKAGPVSVGAGDSAVAAAQQANAQQPVQVDLHIIQVGANPKQTLDDALDHVPGGRP